MARGLLVAVLAAVAVALAASDARACTGAECYMQAATLGESPATGASVLRFPQAIAYSPGASTIFVADQYSGVVQRFDRSGTWLGELGGYADARQVGRIGVVGGLATDRAGHVYVLDSENDRVQVFEAATGRWLAAWGSTGQGAGRFRLGDNTGAGGIAIAQPTARRRAGGLRRRPVQPPHPGLHAGPGRHGRRRAPGAAGRHAGRATWSPCPPRRAVGDVRGLLGRHVRRPGLQQSLQLPAGHRRRPPATGHVLVADDDNHRVVEFLPDGTYVRQIGSYGVGAGQFRFPYDVGIDAREPRQLYVADNNNHRVQAFDFATLAFQRTWGQFGTEVGDFGFTRALAARGRRPGGWRRRRRHGQQPRADLRSRRRTDRGVGHRRPRARLRHAPGGRRHRRRGHRPRGRHARPPRRAPRRRRRLSRADGLHLGQLRLRVAQHGQRPVQHPGRHRRRPRRGRVWVADTANSRVQALGLDGTWQATATGFSAPRELAVAPDGAVYVADTGNGRVQRRDPASRRVDDASPAGAGLAGRRGGHERRGLRRRHRQRPDPAHRRRAAPRRCPRPPAA